MSESEWAHVCTHPPGATVRMKHGDRCPLCGAEEKRMGCKAIAKSTGEICDKPTLAGSEFCLFHDDSPETAALRERGRRAGGQRTALRLPKEAPHDLTEIRANVAELIVQLQSAPASAANIRALLDCYTLSAKLYELDDMDQRLKALEAAD